MTEMVVYPCLYESARGELGLTLSQRKIQSCSSAMVEGDEAVDIVCLCVEKLCCFEENANLFVWQNLELAGGVH